jgi:ABC-type transport system involved in multi-copper enzyme maturation permease subunit
MIGSEGMGSGFVTSYTPGGVFSSADYTIDETIITGQHMNSAPRASFLARTIGWSGSRQEWLTLLGLIAWLGAGVALWRYSKNWALGETILAGCVWLLLLLVAARDAVQNLFGPVFLYDLVRVGRNRWTFWIRWGYILILAGTLGLMYYAWLESHRIGSNSTTIVSTGLLASFGSRFFETVVIIQFIVISLLTPVYLAGTIVVEKERKTLEFLFATDLHNREIIFGKLASRVINLLMYILAALPVLAFAQFFGGIDPEMVLASTVATATTVVGLAAISLWFSTFLRRARDAIMLTYLSVGVYLAASIFLVIFLNVIKSTWTLQTTILGKTIALVDFADWAAEGNLIWQITKTQSPIPFGVRPSIIDALRNYLLWWAVVSGLLLVHAIVRLRAVSLQQAYGAVGGARSRKKKVATTEGEEKIVVNEATSKHPPIGSNPMIWKEVFVDSGMGGGCAGKVIACILLGLIFIWPVIMVWFAFIDPWRNNTISQNFYYFQENVNIWLRITTGGLTALLCLCATLRGAGAVSGEKDKDSWISLLSTTMTAREMLSGKWWGCVLGVRRPFGLLILIWCMALSVGAVEPAMLALDLICIVIFVSAFAWIGLFCSMTARNTLIASIRAFFTAVFFSGGYWLGFLLCCVIPFAILDVQINGRDFVWIPQLLLAMTPPILAGWMPLSTHELAQSRRHEPFDSTSGDGIGLLAPVLAMVIWLGFTIALRFLCHGKFREVANRESEASDVPRRQPESSTAPQTGRYE